jgi:hypothetical protein
MVSRPHQCRDGEMEGGMAAGGGGGAHAAFKRGDALL